MVFEKVKSIIVDNLSIEESSITLDSRLREDLNGDSLDAVEMVMACEEEFDIEIPDDEVIKFKTVKDIVEFIEAHI